MINRYRRYNKKSKIYKVLMIPILLLLFYAAIKVGTLAGNFLFDMDSKIVKGIDTGSFKAALNNSIPIIDTIYNSGNVSISFSGEINSLIKSIFDFDLNTPMTVLNAQSPMFYSYYYSGYKSILAERSKQNVTEDRPREDINEGDTGKINQPPKLEEVASSISFDEEDEKKDLSENNVVSNGKITIHNETNYKVDIDKLLKEELKLNLSRKGPKVLIYHTHTSESYLNKIEDLKKKGIPNWSSDQRNNVVRVGEELAQSLRKKYGIEVIHNASIHDYPTYNGAYGRSLSTVNKILKSYPSIKVVIDIHRDGVSSGGEKLRTATKINGKNVSRVMFVLGTDSPKLPHPNWQQNLKLALKLQQKLNEQAPDLARHIYMSKNRYNQHVANGALIIEIGGDGNLLSESLESTKYLAKAISDVIK